MISHHPPVDMLLDYAVGSLASGPRLVVAAQYAAFCTDCRQQIGRFESVGGAMLNAIKPVAVSEDLLPRIMAAIDKAPQAQA